MRHAIRSLRRSPGLVIVCVLSLGLGLGVNLAVFSAIEAVFFYEPSLADPSRVYAVQPGNSNQFSYLNYRDLRDSGIVETAAGSRGVTLNLRTGTGTETERVDALAVTASFFEFVGIPLALGRGFTEAEAAPERQPRVAVLSHPYWQRRFNADPAVIGRELTINGESFSVIGVLPEGYRSVRMLEAPGLYVPLSALVLPTVDDRSNGNALNVLARLHSGTTREQAQQALTALWRRLQQAYPAENGSTGSPARVFSLRGGELADSPAQIIGPEVLLALFGLVLLSACANVAGLLLARAAGRQREVAVRVALGASRAQIVRLLLTESFGLAAVGTITGALLSIWLMRALSLFSIPGAGSVNLDLEPSIAMAAYAVALLVITGTLCGLAPAWQATKRDVASAIQGSASLGVTGRLRLRHAFVVGQVAACLLVLVLSSLMLRTVMRVATMDLGFDVERGLVANLHVDAARYAADGGLPLGERLVERLSQLPGVESASFANILALGNDRSSTRFEVLGRTGYGPRTYVNSVAPRYFDTLGVPLLRGRDFSPGDRQGGPPVAIVSEGFERAHFPGQTALGQRIRREPTEPYFEIVGVVGDYMYGGYGDASTPLFFTSYTQQPRVSTQVRPVVVHVRAASPGALVTDVRRAIAGLDPQLAFEVQTLRQATGTEPALRRFGTQLLGAAGGLGLLLAAIGLYGTMAFVVATRTAEIGLRMAVGATTSQILEGVLSQGMKLVGIGLAIGGTVALALAQLAAGMLAGLSPADPVAFAGTATLLLMVGAAACYIPARRASSIDPIVALRRL
jgi:putative ABC transport system permease protein